MTPPTPSSPATGPANRTGHSAAETVPAAPTPNMAAGTTPIYRVFWSAGGEPVFRDHTGRIRPVHVTRLRCVRHALWRMAREARGDERTRLCTIYAEASEALADTMAWRMAGVRR